MKDRYDLLIFDWDGTLFDSVPWIVNCLRCAAADCTLPIPTDADARAVIGLSLELALMELFPHEPPTAISTLTTAYKRHYMAKPANPDGLFSGIPEMLERFKQAGYRLGVATGKHHDFMPKVLESTGTTHWFDAVRGSDATLSKPDPRMLHEIMADLGVPAGRTLMIGDSIHDLRMAANAEVAAVAVSCGANTADELLSLSPICCIEQTRELLPMLL